MLTQTQRDNILAVISSYEARMKIIRDCFERREPVPKEYEAYVDPLKDKDVVAAFESLTILLACVQELERMVDIMAEDMGDSSHADGYYRVCRGCKGADNFGMGGCGKDCLKTLYEQAAKDIGNEQF